MYASQCFQKAWRRQARLHLVPRPARVAGAGDRVTYFRGRCLACHADKGCGLPPATRRAASPEDSCIECHMPKRKSSVVAHGDHRSCDSAAADASDSAAVADDWPRPGQMPLWRFHRIRRRSPRRIARLASAALVDAARKKTSGPSGSAVRRTRFAAPGRCDGRRCATVAWEAVSRRAMLIGRPADAQAACAAALAVDPEGKRRSSLSASWRCKAANRLRLRTSRND